MGRVELVLVGAGHAHVQLLARWIAEPVANVALTLVVDRPRATYSGMVPGFVAGDYAADELDVDAIALAERAGARVILAAATAVDADRRRIALEADAEIAYDVASLDVGSTVRGLAAAGVRAHALATRPIGDFVARVEACVQAALARGGGKPRVAVVGAGIAGVELGFTLRARLVAAGASPEVTVLGADRRLLPGDSRRLERRVRREAAAHGIALRTDARALGVEPGAVLLAGGRAPADLVVWATGAAPPALIARSRLPVDPAGFVRVDRRLLVVGHDGLFAVGDCAAVVGAPWMRKAGVYAVREGPVLDANVRATLLGRPLRRYRPQRRVLAILNLGERRAVAAKWGLVAAGRWVWRWKDRIDRRWMERFRVR